MGNMGKYRVHKLLSCVLYALPLAGLFALDSSKYLANGSEGVTIAFWGYVAVGFIIIGFKNKIAEFIKKDTLMSVSIGIFLVALIMEFLARQLLFISGASIVGSVLSHTVEPVADVYYDRVYKQISETKRMRIKSDDLTVKEAWKQAYGMML